MPKIKIFNPRYLKLCFSSKTKREEDEKSKKFLECDSFNAAEIDSEDIRKRTSWHELGKITIPTGELVACDGYDYIWTDPEEIEGEDGKPYIPMPLEQKVPIGKYRLEVLTFNGKRSRNIAVRMKINDKEAINYKLAKRKIAPEDNFESPEYFSVDSGCLLFGDSSCALQLAKESEIWGQAQYDKAVDAGENDPYLPEKYDPLEESFKDYKDKINTYATLYHLDEGKSKENIMFGESGYGDGNYRTYFGYDDEGELCSVYVSMIYPGEYKKA